MAYNHAAAEKKWLQWKEQEETKMRELGVDEETIRQLREYDRSEFNAERRYRQRQQPVENVIIEAERTDAMESISVGKPEDILDQITDERLLEILKKENKITLQILFYKLQGKSSKEIAAETGLSVSAVDYRVWYLRQKVKKALLS